jgi:hypothetical protein
MTNISKVVGEPDLPGWRYGAQGHEEPHGQQPAQGSSAVTPATQGNNSALVLLIVAGVSTFVGCFPAVPAVILGILGVVHQRESPSRSARLTRWGWIAYAIGAGLMAAAGAALMLIAGYAASGND